jgi:hypothetical protein
MFIIDRFEDKWAIIEFNREFFQIPKSLLPENAKEGDILSFKIAIAKKETMARKKAIDKMANSLFEE